ncbi:hypothetical protein DS745_07960 [Anaerobacillus alkaliphilus]|uniref:Uncharacterized protein n=1 Tax=Anaerobacillus alkaliphilus TaxID=1548597 RepID=A0A4Q0VUS2_9BACI|nr:hypothetical protein [Anaerobacillus alkaliphilus]RXJ02019.1 hypothetical protein DS745_07960 [Anaerobacillus alkaliphilus]
MKEDYRVWLKIGVTYFVILTMLYIPIVLFNLFPSNYTYKEAGDSVIIEHGIFQKETMEITVTEENIQEVTGLLYHIRSIHSLTVLGVPLLSFICVGFLFQFSKGFKAMKGIAATRKRAVAWALITTVILLWLIGEFLFRRENIVHSLTRLLEG